MVIVLDYHVFQVNFFFYRRTIFSKKYFPVPCVMFHIFAYSVFINLLGGPSSLLLEDVHEGIV